MKLSNEGWAVIEGDTYLSQEIIDKKRLDVAADFLEQYRKYIPVGGVVVDVGASLGDYTATFSEMVGPTGQVLTFEPNPPVFQCLLHNMRNYANVRMWALGISDKDDEWGGIIPDTNNIGASRIERNGGRDTQMVTLDHILTLYKCGALDFLKIDAEGWEPLILDGAANTINAFRPVMLIEVNTWPLGKMGFTAEDVFKRLDALNYIFDRCDVPYADILCLPKERVGLPI